MARSKVVLARTVDCPKCGGLGEIPNPEDNESMPAIVCPKCEGEGEDLMKITEKERQMTKAKMSLYK